MIVSPQKGRVLLQSGRRTNVDRQVHRRWCHKKVANGGRSRSHDELHLVGFVIVYCRDDQRRSADVAAAVEARECTRKILIGSLRRTLPNHGVSSDSSWPMCWTECERETTRPQVQQRCLEWKTDQPTATTDRL